MRKERCANCGDTGRPRGRWSPYFCEPCDLRRMKILDDDFAKIAAHSKLPYERMWPVRSADPDLAEQE